MPAFPDRESSLLNKLYETAPWTAKLHQTDDAENGTSGTDVLPPIEMPTIEPEVNIGQFDNALITTGKLFKYSIDALHVCWQYMMFIT